MHLYMKSIMMCERLEEKGMIQEIRQMLFQLQDTQYRDFHKKLIPTIDEKTIIGVRVPELRKLARKLVKQEGIDEFLLDLPHAYYEENQLHALMIAEEKDFEISMQKISRFLPYIDNWAVCDQKANPVYKKNKEKLLTYIEQWIESDQTYTVRYAIGLLMQHFLDDAFDIRYPKMAAAVRSEEYYIQMMVAWYFATALAKQYEAILPFIEEKCLDVWTHNKAIQKAVESYRITPEQKAYLKTLKV